MINGIKQCSCGNTYFEEAVLYHFRTEQTSIYNGQRKQNQDEAIKLMKCFCCNKYYLPDLGYAFMPDIEDQKLAKKIKEMVDKKNLG